MRLTRWKSAIALAVGTVALAVSSLVPFSYPVFAASTSCSASTPKTSVQFADHDASTIQAHFEGLLCGVPSGSTVRIAMFSWTQAGPAAAVIAAVNRGVRVQVLTDAGNTSGTGYNMLKSALGTNTAAGSWIVACKSGCVGTNINHDKFFLFSTSGGQHYVVVQSSGNFTNTPDWNNAITFVNEGLYRGYYHRFEAMEGLKVPLESTVVSDGVKVYFYPALGNDVLSILNNVKCPSTVDVAVYQFTNTAVTKKLNSLATSGCSVSVKTTYIESLNKKALSYLGSKVKLKKYPFVSTGYLHDKYLIISGHYDGSVQHCVWTGTLNYTNEALHHNDESVIKYCGSGVYAAYLNDFNHL